MATSTNVSLPRRGRPKLGIKIKTIGLHEHIYDDWMAKKKCLGFGGKSNSDFAKHLLGISSEHGVHTPLSAGRPYHSTPVGKLKSRPLFANCSPMAIVDDEPTEEIVNVDGVSSLDMSRVESVSVALNPEFGVFDGNISSDTLSEDSDYDEESSVSSAAVNESPIEELGRSDLVTNTDEFHIQDYSNENTLTDSEGLSSTKGEEDMEISDTECCGSIEVGVEPKCGPETREEWTKRLIAELKEKFQKINNVGKDSEKHKQHIYQDRVVVDVDIVLEMFQKCPIKTCSAQGEIKIGI